MRLWDKLEVEVPANEMTLDYSLVYGGEPALLSPQDLVATWQPLIDGMTSTQHVVS